VKYPFSEESYENPIKNGNSPISIIEGSPQKNRPSGNGICLTISNPLQITNPRILFCWIDLKITYFFHCNGKSKFMFSNSSFFSMKIFPVFKFTLIFLYFPSIFKEAKSNLSYREPYISISSCVSITSA